MAWAVVFHSHPGMISIQAFLKMVSDLHIYQMGLLVYLVILGIPSGDFLAVLTYMFSWIGILSRFPHVHTGLPEPGSTMQSPEAIPEILGWGRCGASLSPL